MIFLEGPPNKLMVFFLPELILPGIFVQDVGQREAVEGDLDASQQLLFDEARKFSELRVLFEKGGLGAMTVDRCQVAEHQPTDFRGEKVIRPHDVLQLKSKFYYHLTFAVNCWYKPYHIGHSLLMTKLPLARS